MNFKAEAARIVDALLNDNEEILMPPRLPVSRKAEDDLRKHPKAVGRDPYTPAYQLPHCRNCGSRHHTTGNCPQAGSHII